MRTALGKTARPLRQSGGQAFRTRVRAAFVVLASAVTIVALAPAASAAYAPEPVGPSWVPNGGVHAVAVDSTRNLVYVGGTFTGGVAALRADTGQLVWNGNANGDVRALALAPGGHLLLGGAFTTVGGFTHRKLAAVDAATGAVDNTVKPQVGGTVRDIVVAGSTVYFGGAFTKHNGIAQGGLGAFDLSTNRAVSAFTASTNGQVYALGSDGARLFIGGKFTTVNGQTRNQLASVTLATNGLDAWAPAMACGACNIIWDLTVDNGRNRVYTVGRNAGTLFTVNKSTGATVYKNVGSVNGDSQAVTLAPDGRVYVGGHFVTVNGVTRMLVAEFDVSGTKPVLGAFSTRFVTTYPGVWAMASTPSRLYVGGDFTQAGATKKYPYFAMFGDASVDIIAPTATVSPASNAVDVATTTSVTVTFSEAVSGVDTATFTLRQQGAPADVPAGVSYNPSTRVATLTPTTDLAAGTVYTATLNGTTAAIRDVAGNPLAPTSSSFTTAPPPDTVPPTVIGTDPGNGVTVPAPASVTVTFSEPVQGLGSTNFTLTPAGEAAVKATVTGSGNQWTLTPESPLTPGVTYTANLGAGITDGTNALDPYNWTFTTSAVAAGDTAAPELTNHTPWANAKGVSRTVNVTATFSEEVTNVTPDTFFLTPLGGGPAIPATVKFNATGGKWVLNPSVTLDANTTYTVTITSGVTDVATPPNSFAGESWNFTTGA